MKNPIVFTGAAKKLDDIDLPRIAHQIKVGEDEMHAVIDVESLNGSGFDSRGRPLILPERHIFWRELGPGAKRDKAEKIGLAYRKWGHMKYPRGSDACYKLLAQMMEIDAEAALRSCSWGMFQIMGFNCKLAGYATAYDMVVAFCADEENHLQGSVNFIVAAGIDDELRNWAKLKRPTTAEDTKVFAYGYNGSGYRHNNYHVKLAARHNHWRKIADTPWVEQVIEGHPKTPDVKRSTPANRIGKPSAKAKTPTQSRKWWHIFRKG